ncbi:MAG TPA: hypothetical protein VN914_02795, partial [Polyangia bacterium]|nr:hypothetical protein [Polyangia bacterium]
MLTALALTLALAPNGGELAACQAEVRRLRAEGATAEVERRKRLSPHEQFALGNANPMAAAALAPAVDRLLGGSAAPAHTLECRTWACRLKVALTKEDERRVNGWMKGLQSDEELGERVAGIEFHAGTPGKDPLSGAGVSQRDVFIALAAPSGKRVPATLRSEPPAVETTPLPGNAGGCAAEVKALRAQIQRAKDDQQAHLSPDERFARGAPAPKLTDELRAVIASKFPDATSTGLELECRALVCRARWEKGPLDWSHQLYDVPAFRAMADGALYSQAIYFVMAPERRADGLGFLKDLVKRFMAGRAAADCEARFPARGTLSVKLHLPKTGEPNEAGELGRVLASYGDELAGTPLGKCLEEAIAGSV